MPSITQKTTTLVRGQTYKFTDLFTYDPTGEDAYALVFWYFGQPANAGWSIPGAQLNDGAAGPGPEITFKNTIPPSEYANAALGTNPKFFDYKDATFQIDANYSLSSLSSSGYFGTEARNANGSYVISSSVTGFVFRISNISPLFTTGSDVVDFNNLSINQKSAISVSSLRDVLYAGLGGSDTVTLPSIANYQESLGTNALNWSDNILFRSGDLIGQHYAITGLDGNYKIQLGAGDDTVNLNGDGSSVINTGTGVGHINILGNGVNRIKFESPNTFVEIVGTGKQIFDFGGGNHSVHIKFGNSNSSIEVRNFDETDSIVIDGSPNVTTYANQRAGLTGGGVVNVFDGTIQVATLIFDDAETANGLQPITDKVSTFLKLQSNHLLYSKTGPTNDVDWEFVYTNESGSIDPYLAPYIPEANKTSGQSGLTLAHGVDIGQQSNSGTSGAEQWLSILNKSDNNIDFVYGFLGKSHTDSLNYLLSKPPYSYFFSGQDLGSKSVSLTTKEAWDLTRVASDSIYKDLQVKFEAASNIAWATLSPFYKTALVDLAFNIGIVRDGKDHQGITQLKLWELATHGEWLGAAYYLELQSYNFENSGNMGASARRKAEAALIETNLGTSIDLNKVNSISSNLQSNLSKYAFSVISASTPYKNSKTLDPEGPDLILSVSETSPKIQSIIVQPDEQYLYGVSFRVSGVWSSERVSHAFEEVNSPTGSADAVRVRILDYDGALVSGSPNYTFTLNFASSGNVEATVISNGGSAVVELQPILINHLEGDAGTTDFAYTVTRTGDTTGASTVTYSVTGSGANPANSADFGGALPTGQVTFAAGETTKTITIKVAGDTTVEPDEGFTVTLSNATGATLGTTTAQGVIANDDVAAPPPPPVLPTVALNPASVSHLEGDTGTTDFAYTLTRTGDTTGTSTVAYSVTGSGANPANAADFGGALPTGQVTFAAGETTKTITIKVAGDTTVEPDEGFTVTLSNATGATLGTTTAQGVIANDDVAAPPPPPVLPTVALGPASVSHAEGDAGTTDFAYTVTRTGDTTGASTVAYSVTGSGANPANAADFGGALPTGQVTFGAGETTKAITIKVAADATVEPAEGFTVTLANATGATLGTVTAQAVITNDDYNVSLNDPTASSLDASLLSEFKAALAEWSHYVPGIETLDFLLNVTPTGGANAAPSVNVKIGTDGAKDLLEVGTINELKTGVDPNGSAADAVINIDPTYLQNELFLTLDRSAAVPADRTDAFSVLLHEIGHTLGIISLRTVPTGTLGNAELTWDKMTALLPDGSAFFTGAAAGSVFGGPVPLTTLKNGQDFNHLGNSLTELLGLDLMNGINYFRGTKYGISSLDLALLKDLGLNVTVPHPQAPTLALGPSTVSQAEGNSGTTNFVYTVTRTGDTTGASTVDWSVTGSGTNPAIAADFGGTLPTGQVSFAAGETSKTITVKVTGDTAVEPDEGFTVTLAKSAFATITAATAQGVIANDEVVPPPPPPILPTVALGPAAVSHAEGDAGTTDFAYTVTRTGDTTGASTVAYSVTGSGANPANAADFGGTLPTGQVTFAAGETTKTITIKVAGDATVEPDEGFTVTLANATGATLGTASAQGVITNDDVAPPPPPPILPTVALGPASVSHAEGDAGTTDFAYTLTRTGDTTGASTVAYSVTGSGANPANAADFGGTLPTGQVTFAAGETTKTITIKVAGDATVEPDEGFTVTLANATGATLGTATAQGIITNDDVAPLPPPVLPIVALGPASVSHAEGDAGTTDFAYTVTRTGDTTGASTVAYSVTGSGANPANAADFGGTLPTGQVTFAAGETTKTITIKVAGDATVEPDEGFTVTLANASGATLGTATAQGVITNDDLAPPPPPPVLPTVALGPAAVSHAEGDAGTTDFAYTVTRTGDTTGASTVTYSVTGSGANPANAADFGGTLPTGPVTFAAGETTKTITINVAGDTTVEPDEGFTVTLSNATGATLGTTTGQGVIANDDVAAPPPPPVLPTVALGPASVSHLEGDTGTTDFAYTVTRTGDTTGASSVTYSVTGSGANPANAADFGGTLPTGPVTFAAGETTKTITIKVAGDATVEPDEGFTVTLANATGATLGTATAQGIITNDDVAPPPPSHGDDLTGTPGPDRLIGDNRDNVISALGGDDTVSGGPGRDAISLGEGHDVLRDTLANLNGDAVTDFSHQDRIEVTDASFGLNQLTITARGATVDLTIATHDGTLARGTITLNNVSGGEFMVAPGTDGLPSGTTIVNQSHLPVLSEGSSVDTVAINGVEHPVLLRGDGETSFVVSLEPGAAAYFHNSIGVYDIAPSGEISAARLIFPDASATSAVPVDIGTPAAGHMIGFFLIQDGANLFPSLANDLSFQTTGGGAARVSDTHLVLDSATLGKLENAIVFHSVAPTLNPDEEIHVITGSAPGGHELLITFEDLLHPGSDHDYQDVILGVTTKHIDLVVT